MPMVSVRYFDTRNEARAFAAGVAHVNDGSIDDISVEEHTVDGTTKWAVNYFDDDDYFDADDYEDVVVVEVSSMLEVYDDE